MNPMDFAVLFSAAQTWLTGGDPYNVHIGINGFYYPLPFLLLMLPFALFPFLVAFGLWTAMNAGFLLAEFRARFWQALLVVPVVYVLGAGQTELLWWFLSRRLKTGWPSALLAALITLKPQSALILLPVILWRWWKQDRRTLRWWAVFTAALWGVPTLLYPQWIARWTAALATSGHSASTNTPGVWGLIGLGPAALIVIIPLCAGLLLWSTRQSDSRRRAVYLLVSPFGAFYTPALLLSDAPPLLLAIISGAALLLTLLVHSVLPFALIPLAVFAFPVQSMKEVTPCPIPQPTV